MSVFQFLGGTLMFFGGIAFLFGFVWIKWARSEDDDEGFISRRLRSDSRWAAENFDQVKIPLGFIVVGALIAWGGYKLYHW
jgi:hypothetical protein